MNNVYKISEYATLKNTPNKMQSFLTGGKTFMKSAKENGYYAWCTRKNGKQLELGPFKTIEKMFAKVNKKHYKLCHGFHRIYVNENYYKKAIIFVQFL